jgi:hypothetical protein
MKIKFGTHYLLTIKKSERARVRAFYHGLLGCKLQAHDHGVTSNIPENIDLFHFAGGEVLGVQYVDDRAPVIDAAGHKLAGWMEIKTDDVSGLVGKLTDFGVDEIRDFWDKEHFYFHAPGGQVYRVIRVD